jgi:hypothetical protein
MTNKQPLNHRILLTLFGCGAVLLLQSTPAHSARLYKWIDEDGTIRYSDQLTVDQAKQKHQTLTPDGRVLETKDAAIPPDQLAKERAERKRLAEEAKINAEKAARQKAIKDHHDNVLLMTFSNEEEILEAKEERLAVIDSVIKLLRKNITNEQVKLDRLEQRAYEQYIEKDVGVPGGLAQNIEYFSDKILGIQQQLALKLEERDRVRVQYADDLLRYRELTQNQNAESAKK